MGPKNIGALVRCLREALGKTQPEIAADMRRSISTIQRYEKDYAVDVHAVETFIEWAKGAHRQDLAEQFTTALLEYLGQGLLSIIRVPHHGESMGVPGRPDPESVPLSEQSESPQTFSGQDVVEPSSELKPWLADVTIILSSGHEVAMKALRHNITAFKLLAVGSAVNHPSAPKPAENRRAKRLTKLANIVIADAKTVVRDTDGSPGGRKKGENKAG